MIIEVTCPNCERTFSASFDDERIKRFENGELLQEVFPELSADDRELFFLTHFCKECWDELFEGFDD